MFIKRWHFFHALIFAYDCLHPFLIGKKIKNKSLVLFISFRIYNISFQTVSLESSLHSI